MKSCGKKCSFVGFEMRFVGRMPVAFWRYPETKPYRFSQPINESRIVMAFGYLGFVWYLVLGIWSLT